MKASELIAILKQFDEDLDLFVPTADGENMEDLAEVSVHMVGDKALLLGESST